MIIQIITGVLLLKREFSMRKRENRKSKKIMFLHNSIDEEVEKLVKKRKRKRQPLLSS
ncbi:hypothetical protein KAX75_06990 [candidate division WOR-3 bacterium]|nr:hypothetical protein [candidate division WOR-3 bacterium]